MYLLTPDKLNALLWYIIRDGDMAGQLMKISLRYTQLKCSIQNPFLEKHLANPTWIKNIWQYCTECKEQMHEQNPWKCAPPRTYDFFLMDEIIMYVSYSYFSYSTYLGNTYLMYFVTLKLVVDIVG